VAGPWAPEEGLRYLPVVRCALGGYTLWLWGHSLLGWRLCQGAGRGPVRAAFGREGSV
jgi:hypothetical protein